MPWPGDGTLLRVDLQLETPLDEAGQILHDPVACLLAADIDVAVVRVSHETVATVLKFAIRLSSTRFESGGESGPPCGVPSG